MINRRTALAVLAGASLSLGAAPRLFAQSTHSKRVLVVLSGARELVLRDGKTYPTGYYLNELAVPLRKIVDAGFTPVFVNPTGEEPKMDDYSNNPRFFGGDDAKREAALVFVQGLAAMRRPLTLSSLAKRIARENFAGLFLPGGHASMQDLLKNRDLGTILRHFHETARPTGIICHGPVALLSAMPDSEAFDRALIAEDDVALKTLARHWPYARQATGSFETGLYLLAIISAIAALLGLMLAKVDPPRPKRAAGERREFA